MSDAAIASIVTGVVTVVTMVVGVITLWLKLKYNVEKVEKLENKLDANTSITQSGIADAKTAADSAAQAKETVDKINSKLNGGIDSALAPLQKTLEEHVKSDEEFMIEMREALSDLKKKIRA